jgi:hypothetical protein
MPHNDLTPTEAFTVNEFCRAFRISRSLFLYSAASRRRTRCNQAGHSDNRHQRKRRGMAPYAHRPVSPRVDG